tara:strand:- start:109 stop:777 length:669 start_codon:yes stop_codon:yes gene_type:complete
MNKIIKRAFDILFSISVIMLITPILIPIMVILRFSGEGNVFYVQQRVGKNKGHFGLIKFATMLQDSSSLPGGDITTVGDPRVLKVGKYLRKTKINELPQFVNILLGDMSVVGPRPITYKNFNFYSQEIQDTIKNLKPGLTGIGSIVFRDEEQYIEKSDKEPLLFYKEDIAPYKGALEMWYSAKQQLLLDLLLIYTTVHVVLFPKSKIVNRLFKDLPKSEIFR